MTKKGNLLIVDDEKDLLDSLHFILEDYADHVYHAQNGLEALDVLSKESIHCVVTDINMPKLNGIDFLKEARKRGIKVPFIAYTGHATKDLIIELKEYDLMDLLNKPFLDGLEDLIQKGLKQGVSLS